jgi:hypothetical protein
MIPATVVSSIREKFTVLRGALDERARRLWAATEATAIGHGGLKAVSVATGMAQSTIRFGQAELAGTAGDVPPPRVRRPGGGRKRLTEKNPGLAAALDALVEPTTRGDPMSALRWTCKSTRKLAEELRSQGHDVGRTAVGELLEAAGYSLQVTQKTKEGRGHEDRDAQFEHIAAKVADFQEAGDPVVSVDTKKKELVGDFANKGREYQPKGQPEKVRVHDFIDPELGKAIPYGVYDLAANRGWVSVGTDHDTAQFAVETIRQWWEKMGAATYPEAKRLLITADGGGSNASRSRLWKVELQRLADRIRLPISVSHLPPGTSKWNKIEHRMFSHISLNWRGRPLVTHEAVVNLIANTTTKTGLKIRAKLDRRTYPLKIKVTDDELEAVRLKPDEFHANWNYTIEPLQIP